jgi:DNA polymerase I-like protein with 3'-5' exonuclease and polymerase domains
MLTDRRELLALAGRIAMLDSKGIVAYDTETGASGETKARWKDKAEFLPYAGAYITGVSLHVSTSGRARKLQGVYIPVGHKYGNADPIGVQAVLTAMKASPALHLLHHCTFDVPFINQLDPHWGFPKRILDTQVIQWLEDENQWKGLKDMGDMYLNEDASKEKRELGEYRTSPWENQTHAYRAVREAYPEVPVPDARAMARRMRTSIDFGSIPPAVMTPYAGRDATLTYEVALAKMSRRLLLAPPAPLQREMELQPVLYHMTHKGISVDVEQLHAAGEGYARRAEELETYFKREYGVKGMTDASKRIVVYDKLGLPCLMRTPKGERSVAKEALEQLQGHPEVAKVMEYGGLVKARTAYAEPFAWFAEHSTDGRIHGKFSSDRTVTGRLAASGPNVMTLPKDNKLPDIRRAFYSTPAGITRYGFDLKSAELWVMASITGDKNLTDILLQERNMHLEMMLEVFGGDADKERPEYTVAKNVNYSMAYEAGLEPLKIYAAKGGFPPSQVHDIAVRCLNGHRKLFPRQHQMSEWLAVQAELRGKLPLHVPGRYRHFTYGVAFYTALNALVQGGIGEFMKDVMLEIWRNGYGEMLVLQVHDELVFDGPDGIEQELHDLLEAIAADINPFKFPMHWDAKRWSEDEAAA